MAHPPSKRPPSSRLGLRPETDRTSGTAESVPGLRLVDEPEEPGKTDAHAVSASAETMNPSNGDVLTALCAALHHLAEDFAHRPWGVDLSHCLQRLVSLQAEPEHYAAFNGLDTRHELISLGRRTVHIDRRARSNDPYSFRESEVYHLLRGLNRLMDRLGVVVTDQYAIPPEPDAERINRLGLRPGQPDTETS